MLNKFTNKFTNTACVSCCLASRTSAQTARQFFVRGNINSNGMRTQESYRAAGVGQAALRNSLQSQSGPQSTGRIQFFALFYFTTTTYTINHKLNSSSNNFSLRQLLQPLPVVQMRLCAGKMCPEQWACAHTLACGTASDRHTLALHLLCEPLQLAFCSCGGLLDAAHASSGTDAPGCKLCTMCKAHLQWLLVWAQKHRIWIHMG